jgi:two-component system, chemotaxis family, sensor kinase CheA
LLVDDSPFFRNLLSPVLSVAGYDVTTLESADDTLKARDSGAMFDVIVSDIEMPGMDGFEFPEAIHSGGAWKKIPLVALSSHTTKQDFARGREVGFNNYMAKFNHESLVDKLADTVSNTAASIESK